MGQHPSKDKDVNFVRSVSERLPDRKERFGSFGKKGSAKQQREISKVNYVLNNAKIIPKNGSNEARNNANKDIKEKKKETKLKNTSGRTNVKGGLVSAIEARPPVTQTAPAKPQPPPPPVQPSPRSTEALAVLVQHLVFNLEAFNNPVLRKEVENARREAEEVRLSYRQLEEALSQEKQRHLSIIQEERMKFRSEIEKLIECHHGEVNLLNEKLKEVRVQADIEKAALVKQHENQMQGIKVELNKLQKNHDESIDILREEIEAVREENEENKDKIRHLEIYRRESDKLHLDYEAKELKLKESYEAEIARLKQEKELFLSASSDGDTTVQEVQSLRAVLDLKQVELAELRKSVAEMSQKAEQLTATEERIALLATKCEDLQHQLKCKNQSEVSLYMENKKLQDSIKEESNQKKRLIQRNEELQWRLQHNKEVFKVLEGADQSFSRSLVTSSFNERHSSCMHSTFERAMSLRERKLSTSARKSRNSLEADLDDISPPSSPKVKGVVEKSDSVSYVLEMDESPEVVASRIVRRSFRNSTSPKNTPTKSPANKRPRKNSLMQSSSVACIPSTPKEDHSRAIRTAPINQADQEFCWGATAVTSSPYSFDANIYGNGDYDEDDIEVFKLPALPSEIGRKNGNTLPVPKHMAGEAMISESASEDESSSSSSSSSRL